MTFKNATWLLKVQVRLKNSNYELNKMKESKAKIYFEHDMYSNVNEISFNLISFNIFV